MPRILYFLFIVFLVWLLVRVLGSRRRSDDAQTVAPAPLARSEPILQCAWCGVHVPAAQAVSLPDGRLYCSDAHRQAALTTAGERARP